jgi:hypothetical protein
MSLRRLAWGLFALYVGLQAATLWVIWDGPDGTSEVIGLVVVGYAFVGALVASRRPREPIGWLLLAIAIGFAVDMFGEAYSYYSASTPGYEGTLIASSQGFTVAVILATVFLPLVFPDGRLLSRRWRPVVWLGITAVIAILVGSALQPATLDSTGGVEGRPVVPNPLVVSGSAADIVAAVATTGDVIIVLGLLLAAASLVVRFRRARGAQRQQLKLFAYPCLLALSGLVIAAGSSALPAGGEELMAAVGWFTFLASLVIGIPVAIGIAILRHRLFDIDVVINRTLVYGSLTAMLAAAYLGLVLLLRLVLDPLAGQSDLAVAASTLAVAALVRPLRSRIQTVVDRRFYRSRYDASRTLERFAGRLRDELDLDALGGDLRRVVDETMQPSQVSLWLREAQP